MHCSSICIISRNETSMLREFISYHIKIGFEKIFLYDNNDIGDNKNLDMLIEIPEEEKSKVEYIEFKKDIVNDFEGRAKAHYLHFKKNFSSLSSYTAHLDTDEFLYIGKNKNINSFLNNHSFSLFNIKRKTFINLSENSPKSILNFCTKRRTKIDNWSKPIIHNKDHDGDFLNAHIPTKINGNICNINLKDICINHYWVTSFDSFKTKIVKSRDFKRRLDGGPLSKNMCEAALSKDYNDFMKSKFVKTIHKYKIIDDHEIRNYLLKENNSKSK